MPDVEAARSRRAIRCDRLAVPRSRRLQPIRSHSGVTANERAADRSAAPSILERMSYFRLVIAVRSAESLTMPVAPHQLEPKPPGLIG